MGLRNTAPLLQLLEVLLADPTREYFGLELAGAAGLHTGTVYPQLARLEQLGWLTSAWEDIDEQIAGRQRRRYNRMTGEGIQCAREQVSRAAADAERRTRYLRPATGRAQ
jgi:PadR family transcriptional regulator, regulatory protein PadR